MATSALRRKYISSVNQHIRLYLANRVNTWLDIGCGDGLRLKQLTEDLADLKLVAIEPSDVMYKAATKALEGRALVIKSSLEDFPGKGTSHFSLVTALWNVIGHSNNYQDFISEAFAMLQENGTLIFDCNNRYNIAEYGLFNVFRNMFNDLLMVKCSGTFLLSAREDPDLRTYVRILAPWEVWLSLKDLKAKEFRLYYYNYRTGKRSRWWSGQMVATVTK